MEGFKWVYFVGDCAKEHRNWKLILTTMNVFYQPTTRCKMSTRQVWVCTFLKWWH